MGLFYFLRHGEATWNAAGRFCGRTEVPLSNVGRQQAQLLAARLKSLRVDALYSSPLGRALETARRIGEAVGREPVVDQRLAELNYGVWEGLTLEEIRRATPAAYRAWDADPARRAPPEGESGVHLIKRLTPFLLEVAQRHKSGNVVVVCHKTVCRLLACHILGVPLKEYRRRITVDNAALSVFATTQRKWRVVTLNDTSHLTTPQAGISRPSDIN